MGAITKIKPDPTRTLLAWERFNDYVLMAALDSDFNSHQYERACIAFTTNDHATMEKIADEAKRQVDFIEAPEVFDGLEKPKRKDGSEREWTVSERYAILRSTPRTRAYARIKLDALLGENDTPFS